MADDSLARIEERLARIEARLSDLEQRTHPHVVPPPPPPSISAFTGKQWQDAVRPTQGAYGANPVPYKTNEPPQPVSVPPRFTVPPERPPLTGPPIASTSSEDAEYKIGAKVLPRVGAVVFLIGVIYLVSLALSRHLISPQMQWAGELFLCLSFIVVGFIKRNEREDFGQLLIGIGSCALYFSFAGAQAFKGIINGNQLVLLFIGLSFANLAFSWWRASRSFWIIGILGGIVGALMPLKEHNLLMNGALQLSIVAVAALVAGRHKWFGFTVLLFLTAMGAASAALFPVYGDEWKQLSFLYADALICLVAMAATRIDTEFDPPNALLPLSAFGVGLLALAVRDGIKGCLHLAIFTVALACISLFFNKTSVSRNRLLVASAAVGLLLAPAGDTPNCVYIYGLVAAALGALSYLRPQKVVTALCWSGLAFELGAYISVEGFYRPWTTDLAFCLLMAASSALAVFSISRLPKVSAELVVAAGVAGTTLGSVALLRAGYLLGMQIDPMHREMLTQVVTSLILAAVVAYISVKQRFRAANHYAWILGAYCLAVYGAIIGNAADAAQLPVLQHLEVLSLREELVLLTLFTGLVVFLVKTSLKLFDEAAVYTWFGTGVVCCLFLRAGFLIGVQVDPEHRKLINQVLASWLLSAGASVYAIRKGSVIATAYSRVLAVDSFFAYLAATGGMGRELFSVKEELAVISLLASLVLLQMRLSPQFRLGPNSYGWWGVLIIGCLFLRSGDVVGMLWDPLHREGMTQVYSGLLVAFGCAFLARTFTSQSLIVLACLFGAYSGIRYIDLAMRSVMHVNEDILVLLALMFLAAYLVSSTLKFGERDTTLAVGSMLFFGLVWRAGFLILTSPMIGMKETAATTLTWTLYAVALISAGFLKKAQILRYLALALFGLTLAKVFLYDLSNLDAGIRVAILMGLGVAMIGGGYWYIRSKKPVLPGSV